MSYQIWYVDILQTLIDILKTVQDIGFDTSDIV